MAAVRAGRRPLMTLGRAGLVAIGGGLGTAARALAEAAVPATPGAVPWTTFGINVAGSFVLGALLELLLRRGRDEGRRRTIRLLCGTGILGGFTTYSTFVAQTALLLSGGAAFMAAAYALMSVALGVGAAAVGILLARSLASAVAP